jgi:hypothetical protein
LTRRAAIFFWVSEYVSRGHVYRGMRDDNLVGEGRLFEPDVMLPVQYFTLLRKQAPQGPEYGLVIAMLQDAVECFQKYRFAKDENGRALYGEASEWLTSDDRKWPFSFENVCGILNLNAEYVRRGLSQWEARQEAAMRSGKVLPFKSAATTVYSDAAENAPEAARAS